jgi:hypothetical protein
MRPRSPCASAPPVGGARRAGRFGLHWIAVHAPIPDRTVDVESGATIEVVVTLLPC